MVAQEFQHLWKAFLELRTKTLGKPDEMTDAEGHKVLGCVPGRNRITAAACFVAPYLAADLSSGLRAYRYGLL